MKEQAWLEKLNINLNKNNNRKKTVWNLISFASR